MCDVLIRMIMIPIGECRRLYWYRSAAQSPSEVQLVPEAVGKAVRTLRWQRESWWGWLLSKLLWGPAPLYALVPTEFLDEFEPTIGRDGNYYLVFDDERYPVFSSWIRPVEALAYADDLVEQYGF